MPIILAALIVIAGASPALAQESAQPQPAPALAFDVDRIPLDLQRIHRELQADSFREEIDGLNVHAVVEVFGQAPPLAVTFTRDDQLLTGPVPDVAPSHREMVEHNTPQEFRSPRADLNALARWLAGKVK